LLCPSPESELWFAEDCPYNGPLALKSHTNSNASAAQVAPVDNCRLFAAILSPTDTIRSSPSQFRPPLHPAPPPENFPAVRGMLDAGAFGASNF
jgi:hypothetical protein